MNNDNLDSGQVLRCVSESLRALIRANIAELQAETAVVFESPAEIQAQGEIRLSLFLYQMRTNPFLRNLPPTLLRQPGAASQPNSLAIQAAPLVADLLYLMVPYARTAEMELVLFDKLTRLFHDMPLLAGPWLHPVLRQSGNEQIDIVPDFTSIEQMHNIWSGFPNRPYKLSKLYLLSPVRIASTRESARNIVTEGFLSAEQRPLDARLQHDSAPAISKVAS